MCPISKDYGLVRFARQEMAPSKIWATKGRQDFQRERMFQVQGSLNLGTEEGKVHMGLTPVEA